MPRELDDEQRALLAELARIRQGTVEADATKSDLIAKRLQLWIEARRRGISVAAIAEASEVSQPIVSRETAAAMGTQR